jgi:hypothetical protein
MAIAVLHGNRPWRHGQWRLLFYMGIVRGGTDNGGCCCLFLHRRQEPHISNLPLQWSDRLSVISQKLLKS